MRGFLVGALMCGALNAASYFYLTDSWNDLLERDPRGREAIGFPLEVWERGNTYNGFFVDYRAVAGNLAFAVAAGAVLGALTLRSRKRLNRLVKHLEQTAPPADAQFQFSVRGLLIATTLAALVAAAGRQLLLARPEALWFIYALGPLCLVALAMLPRKISWEQRVLILTPTALALIAAAVMIGASLKRPLDFEQVLLGVFVCWTPQSALAAAVLTAAALTYYREVLAGAARDLGTSDKASILDDGVA